MASLLGDETAPPCRAGSVVLTVARRLPRRFANANASH
jgi:hypothetical protein